MPGNTNAALAGLLDEVGLTPRSLAREMNRLFGAGTLAETAPYHWRDRGGVPRPPLPALAAFTLSRILGRVVAVRDVWPDQPEAGDATLVLSATAGLDGPWTRASMARIAEDWLMGGLVDRRLFLSVSGAVLAQALTAYLSANLQARYAPVATPEDPLVDQIAASIPHLQVLDDERGGASGLTYVGAQVRAVLLVLREGGHTEAITRRLLIALADLAQLAGWKAFDAGQNGLAQRYYLTGLRAAHDAGYHPMAAHILADLSFLAASAGDISDGLTLGDAALRAAAGSPESVRASVLSRFAFAHAAAGDADACGRFWTSATDCLARRQHSQDPDWMYYLTPNHLDCQAGYAMILAGRLQGGTHGRALLRKGEALLRSGAYARPPGAPYQRRALYEGAWLALGYTAHGKLEDACEVARMAIPRLHQVQSPRSVALLATLTSEFGRRRRNPYVADVLPELEAAMAVRSVT